MRTIVVVMVLAVACCDGGEPREATLTAVRADIFDPRCSASVCHGNNGARGLDLQNEPFEGLVGVASIADPDILRVSPGDPDNSLLFQVVQAPVPDVALGELRQMPIGAQLDAADLDQLRRWIEEGAENN